jgi:hypothetical protein
MCWTLELLLELAPLASERSDLWRDVLVRVGAGCGSTIHIPRSARKECTSVDWFIDG